MGTQTQPVIHSATNADVDSMVGAVDGGVVFDIKSTPHQIAIEETQVELSQEYNAREERRRELEFLEKGGNPLDFQFLSQSSLSVKLTPMLLQQNSSESNGNNGTTKGRNTSKRKNTASFEKSSRPDVSHNSMEADDSVVSDLDMKSPVYAQKKRSKLYHESLNLVATDPSQTYGTNLAVLSSSEANLGNTKPQEYEMHTFHTTTSNPKTKNKDSMIFASEDHLDMELDEVEPHKVPTGVISTPHLISSGEDTMLIVNGQPSCEASKDSKHSEIICKSIVSGSETFAKSDVNTDNLQDKDQTIEENGVHNGTRITTNCGNCNIDDNAGGGQIFQGESDSVLIKEQKQISESNLIPENTIITENGNVRTPVVKQNVHSEECHVILNASISHVEVKNNECFENEAKKQTQTAIPNDSIHSTFEISSTCHSQEDPPAILKIQDNTETKFMKDHEDAILKEAQIIEDKLKMAQELPKSVLCSAKQLRPHWDYVLEEMAWLANDFMQERLWKITAASQVCRRIALIGREKFKNNNLRKKQMKVSHILAREVIKFWNLAKNKDKQEGDPQQSLKSPIMCYAARFLQSGFYLMEVVPPEAPPTPDRISDAGTLELEWEERNSDEMLHYKIPFGSMHTYGQLKTHCSQHENIGKFSNQMDCEASVGDSESNAHITLEEDEAETSMCYMPQPFEGNRSLNFLQNNRKNLQQKSGASRSYGAFDFPYVPDAERNFATQPLLVMGKRASGTSNASLKSTKRVRSTGGQQMTVKTDASSGDTNSIHDDQYSLQGGSHPGKNSDFESTVDFEKNLSKYTGYKNSSIANDCGGFIASEKLQGSSYKQGWPVDSFSQPEQKKYLRKKTEGHHFESNGTSGLYAQQFAKKPKTMKQSPESSPKPLATLGGALASQINKIANSNKILKVIPNRGKKPKAKAGAAQPLSGSPWSLFEDQTLVVLVHDMGPNWELVSDVINSTLQLKHIFWKPQDCMERHKILMDNNSSDAIDSTEDSESTQPYPSTLHGIPNGCAGQLFQCLQSPIERDILKAHFEKIILIGKKRSRKIQRDNLDVKQPSPAHSSHLLALSQACPNNLTGNLLMPLDLCDATTTTTATPELLKKQGTSNDGSTLPNYKGPVTPVLPPSGSSIMHQGSMGMVVGNSFPSPSTAANAPTRDSPRYDVPRPATLLADDQQKTQQCGQMVSGRSVPEPLPVGTDRGVRTSNGGNCIGISRGVPIARSGSQATGSPRALNTVSSGSKLSSSGVGTSNPVNNRPVTGHGQGNSNMKPHDSLQMLRPSQNPEAHRQNQMVKQELQIQATQGNAQTGIHTTFSNQTLSSSVQPYPMQQPQMMHPQPRMLGRIHQPHIQGANHARPQQQTYAMNIAKQRQLQQRLAHQKQAFSGSSTMTPLQKGSHFPQQTQSSSSSPMMTSSLAQQKHQNISCNNLQTNISLPNQTRQKNHQQIPLKQLQQPVPVPTKSMKGNQIIDNKHMMQQSQATTSGGSNQTPLQTSTQQKRYTRPQTQSSIQMPTVSSHLDSCNQGHVQIPSSLPMTSQNQQQRPKNQPHQMMQRGILHQNHQLCSDGHTGALVDSVQTNQTIASPSTQCVGLVNPNSDVISPPAFSSQWKSEPSNEANTRTSNSHISNASLTKLVGAESSIASSTLSSPRRQFTVSNPVHGLGTGESQIPQNTLPQKKPPYPNQNHLHHQEEQSVAVNGPSSNLRQ